MRPSMSSRTCSARVGLGRPEALAEGAAIYPPAARISAAATGWLGMRTATVISPPLVSAGTSAVFLKTIVSGPGHQAAARRFAASGISAAIGKSASISAICTIRGLSEGRPFAA